MAPRWDRLEELNAEARGPKEGKRKAGTLKELLNRPKKGGLDLTDARKRRLVEPKSGPSRANRPTAEPERRPLRMTSRKTRAKGTVLTDRDRSTGSREVFGMRWQKE